METETMSKCVQISITKVLEIPFHQKCQKVGLIESNFCPGKFHNNPVINFDRSKFLNLYILTTIKLLFFSI